MGLFDLFSGQDDAEAAAAKNAALYNTYGINAGNLYNQYKTGATDTLTGAANTAVGTLGSGLTNTLGALNTGLQGSLGAGQAGVAAYAPLSQLGQSYAAPVNKYYNALGVNRHSKSKQTLWPLRANNIRSIRRRGRQSMQPHALALSVAAAPHRELAVTCWALPTRTTINTSIA
jgi:hypothetical protein